MNLSYILLYFPYNMILTYTYRRCWSFERYDVERGLFVVLLNILHAWDQLVFQCKFVVWFELWLLNFLFSMYKSISKRFFLIEQVPPWSWTWNLPWNRRFWKPCSMLSFRVVLSHYVVTSPKNVNVPSGLLGFWNGPTFFRGLMSKVTPILTKKTTQQTRKK